MDNGIYVEWNDYEWGPVVKNLSKSKTKCSLYFRESSGIDYIKYIPIVENGEGLYLVKHEVSEIDKEWNKSEYRYAGSNPNNYVSFNNEIWRIIGVVNVKTEGGIEQRIKIVRQDGVGDQNNFGEYSLDIKSDNNSSNDWNVATLKNLLNGIYYESNSGDCYKANLIPQHCDFTGNGEQPKGLDEIARNMIDKEVIWNLGGYDNAVLTPMEFYEKERGLVVYQEHPAVWSNEKCWK